MRYSQYNTYKFFRHCFRIPERVPLRWCIVEQIARGETEWLLGVQLEGTDLYIDVAGRRFYSQIARRAVVRRCHPAERISDGDFYIYRSEEVPFLREPKSFIGDIYYPALFDRELLAERIW